MKTIKILLGFVFVLGLASCTSDFVEINKNPNAITSDEASAKYFITNPQYKLYAPDRYPYWRAHLINVDRYAGHFCFGFSGCWWYDNLSYVPNSGYTDAAWDWMEGYFSGINNFMGLTEEGADFENPLMYAAGQIIKGLYYQMFTDLYGMIPFSEAGNPDITQPAFDSQNDIYQGIIALLDQAMATIGDNTRTGDKVNDLGENDVWCGGDLQQWKKMANTLKLRIALRAYGAPDAAWAETAIDEALAADLLDSDVVMEKDNVIDQWSASCYGDIWHGFGGTGSKWTVGKTLIDYLRDNDDPRLEKYAQVAEGGQFSFTRPKEDVDIDGYTHFWKRVNFMFDALADADDGSADITLVNQGDTLATITVPEEKYYIGQPTRLNGKVSGLAKWEFFSKPAEIVTQQKNQGQPIFPELVMTAAESYFLQAEAKILGFGSGSENQLYQDGITAAMALWDIPAPTTEFQASPMWTLTGTDAEKLEQINVQRWIALYTDGFEAWSVIRKSGYPSVLADGITDADIFAVGEAGLDDAFPQRMHYGNAPQSNNLENYTAAVAVQGPDHQGTLLWWAKIGK